MAYHGAMVPIREWSHYAAVRHCHRIAPCPARRAGRGAFCRLPSDCPGDRRPRFAGPRAVRVVRSRVELTTAELRRAHLTKSLSRTRTGLRGPALVTTRSLSTFQKRLECPGCGERGWCEVLNISELQSAATGIAVRCMGGALALMAALGFALSAVSDIFL